MRKQFIAAAVVAACMFVGTGTALAGEVNGNGDPVEAPDHDKSLCVYSGLEDGDGDPPGPGEAQSWGQVVKSVPAGAIRAGADGPHLEPGTTEPEIGCNAHLYPINTP